MFFGSIANSFILSGTIHKRFTPNQTVKIGGYKCIKVVVNVSEVLRICA